MEIESFSVGRYLCFTSMSMGEQSTPGKYLLTATSHLIADKSINTDTKSSTSCQYQLVQVHIAPVLMTLMFYMWYPLCVERS